MLNVRWLPAHPADGSTSMNRYWWSLDGRRRELPPEVHIDCPLGEPQFQTTRFSRWNRFWNRRVAYPALVRRDVKSEVVHILDHSTAYLIPHLPETAKVVVTVHDLIPLQADAGLTLGQLARFRRCVEQLRRATLVAAVSRHTRAALQSELGIPEDRIVVISNGVDPRYREESSAPPRLRDMQGRHLLFSIGSTQSRKNLQIFPRLLQRLRLEFPDIALVRVGAPFPELLRQQIEEAVGRANLLELGFVPEDELPGVYRAASVLVFPSLYEGFGLPLLEAMSAGCPVASSNATSLPEVGGDAVAYFDPDSAEIAAIAVGEILRDGAYRQQLIQRGQARARQFTWSRHVQQLVHAYRFAATGDPHHLQAIRNATSLSPAPSLVTAS